MVDLKAEQSPGGWPALTKLVEPHGLTVGWTLLDLPGGQREFRGVVMSDDKEGPDGRGRYRYALLVEVNPEGHDGCAFIGLNPSTATELKDDPTMRKCKEFARRWGYRYLWMVNCYALRSTDPKGLKKVADPVGPANDAVLAVAGAHCMQVVACWGKSATHLARGARVRREMLARGVMLHCLGLNLDGSPEHPLYIPYERPLGVLEKGGHA